MSLGILKKRSLSRLITVIKEITMVNKVRKLKLYHPPSFHTSVCVLKNSRYRLQMRNICLFFRLFRQISPCLTEIFSLMCSIAYICSLFNRLCIIHITLSQILAAFEKKSLPRRVAIQISEKEIVAFAPSLLSHEDAAREKHHSLTISLCIKYSLSNRPSFNLKALGRSATTLKPYFS